MALLEGDGVQRRRSGPSYSETPDRFSIARHPLQMRQLPGSSAWRS
jgi:hypothetical protein